MLTVREAAAYATVSEALVRRWIADGSLPVLRLGTRGRRGHIRIQREDLAALLASFRVVRAGPEPAASARPAARPKPVLKHLRLS